MRLGTRDASEIQIEAVATFLISFGGRMNILSMIRVKILVLVKWSYRSFLLCLLYSLNGDHYFEHVVQSLLDICLL